MSRIRKGLRPRTEDSGFTLIEMVVVMSIFSLIITITYSILTSVQAQTTRTLATSDSIGDARLALQQIDREIRSGNVLYSPANEKTSVTGTPNCYASTSTPDAGNCMRVYTRASDGSGVCVQWRITNGELASRSWPSSTPSSVTGWRIVARNVVNYDTIDPPAFVLQGTSTNYGSRLVDIDIQVQSKDAPNAVTVETSLSGRNTEYGYDPSICTPVPASS